MTPDTDAVIELKLIGLSLLIAALLYAALSWGCPYGA
jgi:hypothetical protein